MIRRTSKWRAGGSIIGMLAMVGTVSIGVIGMSGSVAGARTVKVKIPNYVNKLSSNTNGWCTPSRAAMAKGGTRRTTAPLTSSSLRTATTADTAHTHRPRRARRSSPGSPVPASTRTPSAGARPRVRRQPEHPVL